MNPNFDIDRLPEEYYDELEDNGWLGEDCTVIYVTVDDYETATTVLKIRNKIVIIRQFRLANNIAMSVDIDTNFTQI